MARALIQPVTNDVDSNAEPHELRFRFDTGRPCLDLVITVGERWRRSFERLRSPQDLSHWLVQGGLAAEPPRITRRDLADARELREAIFRITRTAIDGRPAPQDDVRTVNGWAARPDIAPSFERLGGGVRRKAGATVDAALATLARDAVDLFGGPLAGRVRECAAVDCSGLFLDTSRARRRRWCSMARCGNREKVAAYRRRRAGTPVRSSLGRTAHARIASPRS
jgi:predicted RNA-binding Zn ribbon-like protein